MRIVPVTRTTISDQVLQQIGKLITEGHLQPGDQLPNERDCAEMFGTTRARIREAFRALALIGMIEIRPGEGTFVSQDTTIPTDALEFMFYRERQSIDEFYAARLIIEPPVFCLACENIEESELDELQNTLNRYREILNDSRRRDEHLRLINTFDLIVARSTKNSIIYKLMQMFVSIKEEGNIKLFNIPKNVENSYKQRCDVLAALRKRNKEEVHVAVRKMLELSKLSYLDTGEGEPQP